MLVYIAALKRELQHIQALMHDGATTTVEQSQITRGAIGGQRVALVQTGIGKEAAQKGAHAALRTCKPDAVFSIGFAGGLTLDLHPGDAVLADSVSMCKGLDTPGSAPSYPKLALPPDPELLARAGLALEAAGLKTHRGRLLTASTAAGVQAKKELAGSSHSLAVDMESYWIAEVMARSGVPFAAVRTISDDLHDDIPNYDAFLNEVGDPQPGRTFQYFVLHPQRLVTGMRLRGTCERASRGLGHFVAAYVGMAGERRLETAHDPASSGR